jgi:hypothetical protein
MVRSRTVRAAVLVAGLAVLIACAGCRVRTEKGVNGEDKSVQVDTPFGGVHVNTDQTTAVDLGLPVYPGAEVVKGDDQHKSADVHLGFGEWQLHVRAVSYATTDPQDKVSEFYKKALGRYGNVITCQGNAPVGTPIATTEGLTCADDGNHGGVKIDRHDYGTRENSLELKAGSKRHQHIVGFEDSKNGKTRFALVALDLPAAIEGKSDSSD